MKFCGCNRCRRNGERNLAEEFEIYYEKRQKEIDDTFNDIFKRSFTIGEMEKLYAEFEPEFSGVSRVVARIKAYSADTGTWNSYEYLRGKYGDFTRRPSQDDSEI